VTSLFLDAKKSPGGRRALRDSVTIKTESASIRKKKEGTTIIKGKDISIDGSGRIDVKASGDITMKGPKIKQN
jgi:type VI secretion system secreted protein VgrG